MSKVQSVIEIVLEIGSFIFLTDRSDGLFNVRLTPAVKKSDMCRMVCRADLLASEGLDHCSFPAGTFRGTGVTKTCQLKRSVRKIQFGDTFCFRVRLLEHLHLLREVFEKFTFCFEVDIWHSKSPCSGNFYDNFHCISSRTLVLNFDPRSGLFVHVPLVTGFSPTTLLNVTVFAVLVYISPSGTKLEAMDTAPLAFDDLLFSYAEGSEEAEDKERLASARLVHGELCHIMLTTLGNIKDVALRTYHMLFPSADTSFANELRPDETFAKLQLASSETTSVASFVEFARETSATLCCLNLMLWEAYLRLVSGRATVKQYLCSEYYRKKAEIYQELYFSCQRDRCSCVLSTRGCLTGAYSGLVRVMREFRFPAMVPRLDVFCPEVDECPTRPVIVFEENYDRFSDLCPLCGVGQEKESVIAAVHVSPSDNGAHCSSTAARNAVTYTPILFADWHDGGPPASRPTRKQPEDADRRAYKRFLKLKLHTNVFGSTNWIMSEPEFVNVVYHTLVFRQLQGSREGIDCCYRSPEPIHFVVFVNGLGGKSNDFFWAKRWMKLLIGTPKHIMIWSEANEKEETFEEIAVCGARLALEVSSYLDNIATKNFKLSFVGFSLGCVLVRAALTCSTMRPYIKNLHTFLSLNGPHLGVLYTKSKLLKFQISILTRINMKGSIKELTFQDSMDIRKCYLYILSQAPGIEYFKNVLLVGSSQDKLVPVHSSNIQHCSKSLADNTVIGAAYDEMLKNLLRPLLKRPDVTLKRFDIFYDTGRLRYLEPVCVSLSHVGALMSRNLFERLMLLSAAEYFK